MIIKCLFVLDEYPQGSQKRKWIYTVEYFIFAIQNVLKIPKLFENTKAFWKYQNFLKDLRNVNGWPFSFV